MMIVPLAANIPPTPWQTEILAPGICAGASPRIWRTLSCNAYMPYMPECMYERPPPLVLSGNLPPGAALRSALHVMPRVKPGIIEVSDRRGRSYMPEEWH
jgi:hypothetical protein